MTDPLPSSGHDSNHEHSHPAAWDETRLLAHCELHFQRRSGPGGQHRNKVETAVRVVHRPTGLIGLASERRQQGENRAVALHRLRLALALHLRQTWLSPSEGWRRRCVGGRLRVSILHKDFPGLVAEALDALAAHQGDDVSTARALGVSRTQFLRFLQGEPAAFEQLNAGRAARGLPRFKASI